MTRGTSNCVCETFVARMHMVKGGVKLGAKERAMKEK